MSAANVVSVAVTLIVLHQRSATDPHGPAGALLLNTMEYHAELATDGTNEHADADLFSELEFLEFPKRKTTGKPGLPQNTSFRTNMCISCMHSLLAL